MVPARVGDGPLAEGCATPVGDGGELLCAGEGFPLRSPPVLLFEMQLARRERDFRPLLQSCDSVPDAKLGR